MTTVTNPERNPNDLTGQQCGGSYKIIRLLGAGGMGQVWLARASELDDKEAAVKVLLKEVAEKSEHLARFKREVRAVGGLRDNNVVQVWDAGKLPDGRHYMIMEFCSGGSLASLLESKGKLSIEETFMLTAGPASALAAAHDAQIIHRDVKPDNILLVHEDGRLRAKLGDFGIARMNSERVDAQFRTATMKMMGTPGFMAPEQVNPKEGIDHRADIFSLGCVLYLCLTGELPFPARNAFQYIEAVWAHPVRPANPRALRPEISPDLDSLIMRCLELDRTKRIQTIEEVMRGFARAIPNGQVLLQFFAPRFVDKTAAPTAITISESIGAAATHFVSAMSLSVTQERRGSLRKIVAAFVAGALVSGGAAALASRPWSQRGSECIAVAVAAPVSTAASTIPTQSPTVAPATSPTAVPTVPTALAPPVPTAPALTPVSVAAVSVDAAVDAPRIAVPLDARVEAPRITAAPVDAGAGVPRITAAPVDAGAGVPRITATPVDAGVDAMIVLAGGDTPKPDKPDKSQRPAEKRPQTAEGTLHVEVQPWADVVMGDWQDTTPVTRKLPAGHHRLVLKKGSRVETVDVVINPNQTTTVTRSW
jgi:serine/threonine protein kinase